MKKKGKRKKQGAEKIVFQVAEKSVRTEQDADDTEIDKTEPGKAKIVEAQGGLDNVETGRRQKNPMFDENYELRKATAGEEELSNVEQGRQREMGKDQNNNNKQERPSEKQKWAVTQDEQMKMIEHESERGGREEPFLTILKDVGTQETPGAMTTPPAQKEQKEEDRLNERKKDSTLRVSLFPNMPLYLNFVTANSLPDIKIRSQGEGLKNMGWNMVAPRGKIPASDITQKEGWAIQGEISPLYI